MATIREIARKAGVSIATVSYVINDIRKVSAETERRVRLAAKELGYRRNRAAPGFEAACGSFAGLVVPDIGNPFFPEIMKSFQGAASLAGMELIVMNTNSDAERTRKAIERLAGLQVAGAAILTTQVDAAAKQDLVQRGIPAVYLDYGAPGKGIGTIAVDYRQGMLEAIAHLAQLGHRKVGLIGGPEDGVAAQKRKRAFFEGTTAAGLEARTIDSDFTVQGGYFSCAKLLSASPPTAVVAANDLMAIGAMHCAFDRRVRVPEDLSIIGFDDITFAQFTQPALTTVAVPRAEIGKLAFEALSVMIASPDTEGATCEVRTNLVIRQTTARPR
ncbi:MAG TPA: LacI family DNA-binding transcriptional regulator [Bryobacteraceae bacterium]|nr:LacI family DNA-binding transcriptional regulator [Bryobacteraceae bacterium]